MFDAETMLKSVPAVPVTIACERPVCPLMSAIPDDEAVIMFTEF